MRWDSNPQAFNHESNLLPTWPDSYTNKERALQGRKDHFKDHYTLDIFAWDIAIKRYAIKYNFEPWMSKGQPR